LAGPGDRDAGGGSADDRGATAPRAAAAAAEGAAGTGGRGSLGRVSALGHPTPGSWRGWGDSDFYFVQADDPETAVPLIIELVKTRIPQRFGLDSIRDIQVLCPMNCGGVGARSLNIELQAALNLAGERKVERFGWTFAPGDKVMQIENDYDKDVYNGDVGYIEDVDPDAGELTASFDGRAVTYGFGELDTLVPGLCRDDPQEPGLRIPRRRDSRVDPTLHDAAAQPALHRRHPREAPS
jgi:hypothetical protein